MALEIGYFENMGTGGAQVAADPISGETRTLSASSALSGATPDSALFIFIYATEAARYAYGLSAGKSPTASAASNYLASGTGIWLAGRAGHKVAGITA